MLIVGCGDLGRRLARAARLRGESVDCVARTAASATALREQGFAVQAVDLDQASLSGDQPAPATQIYYLAPPPAQGSRDPRLARFLAGLSGPARRIVYVSTTGVYGDCGGAWVDETRPANPQVDRARRRWDAEKQLQAWRAAGGGELVILRVAGIYGPDKLPLERLQRSVPMVSADEAPWTNRIHIDDLVSVCEAAMARGGDGEVYNVSDGTPGNMRDYFDRVADLYGLAHAPVVRLAEADGQLSAGLLSYLGESRRLNNRKMLAELGVTLCYPDLASGLAACRAAASGGELR